MQRIYAVFFLTLFAPATIAQERSSGPAEKPDVEVSELSPVHDAAPARFCVGANNQVRVTVLAHHLAARPIPLRLSLVLPDGPPAGALIAEGSITVAPDRSATFTFLHVEVLERLRGRGAKIVVRANGDQVIAEQNLANNVRQLDLDAATDWDCHG